MKNQLKKFLTAIFVSVFIFGTVKMYSQTYSFVFSHFTSTYTPLSGGTDVYNSIPWDGNSIRSLPIGFNYNFLGESVDTVDMVPGIEAFPVGEDYMGFYSFYAELADVGSTIGQSAVTYETTGAPGSQVFKIQCSNAGFSNEFDVYGGYSSAVNFQTWFYQADRSIEVHMGPSTIAHPLDCYPDSAVTGPMIGVVQYDSALTTVLYSLLLNGGPANPTTATWNPNASNPPVLNATPANGQVYRFAQLESGISEAEQVFGTVGMFPNPANENSTIIYSVKNPGIVAVEVKDIEGRVVLNDNLGMQAVGAKNYNVNTGSLSDGIYFVTLVSGEHRITQKLSVTH